MEERKFIVKEASLLKYYGECGSRLFLAALHSGDASTKKQGFEMVEQAMTATEALCKRLPDEGELWPYYVTRTRLLAATALKDGDSLRAYSLLIEAIPHAEKAAQLMPDQPITRQSIATVIYEALDIALKQPNPDSTLCIDLSNKSVKNWLLAHEQGYRVEDKRKLSSHVWLVYESLKLVLKTPEKATIPQRLDEVKALLDESLRKAPDDPMLLEGSTKFKEYDEVLRRMAKEG